MSRSAAFAAIVLVTAAVSAGAEPPAANRGAGPAGSLDGLLDGFRLGGERGPVRINADTMEFDYKTKILTYRGDVTVTQADLTLRASTLTVTLDSEKAERAREVVAEGNVQIVDGKRKASGGRAVFDQAARTVTLSQQAHLQDGPNEIDGEKVVVYLDEQRSVVEGGRERVRAVLYPESDDAVAKEAKEAEGHGR